jgi:uncharacterized protein (TIGR02246 family)
MQRIIRNLSAALCIFAIAASAAAQDKPAAAAGGPTPRQAILTLLAQLETGFNEGDAKGVAACWTETGEFVGPGGVRISGRESIEKQFKEMFAARKDAGKLQIHINHLRLVHEGLALVEAASEVKPAVAAGGVVVSDFVLVKPNAHWLVESAHESVAHLPPQTNRLKELDWLVGHWASETSKAGITLHSDCDWTANHAFLIRKFRVEGKETMLHDGTEIIGWDPRANQIRSWVFDSNGGFGENVWMHDGKRWLIKYSGTLADGSETSATHILSQVDTTTSTLQSKDRVVNGATQPDIAEIELKRQSEAKPAAKAEEPPKAVEKPARSE